MTQHIACNEAGRCTAAPACPDGCCARAAVPLVQAAACQCGVRHAAGCPGAWEPGCDLGNNPDHVRVASAEASAAVDKALGIDRAADAMLVARTEASALLDYCSRMGLVLTIEQVPLQPLAMGNYVSRVSVRKARGAA